jgi:hypothetical protein
VTDRRGAHAGAHRASSRRRHRTVLLLATALVAVAGIVAGFLLWPDDPAATPDRTADAPVAGVRDDLLEWTDAELPAGDRVEVPTAVRAGLLDAGADPARFPAPGGPPAGALRLLVDEPLPSGAVVLARFDDDGAALTLVDPTPVEPTSEELARRARLAAAVLANPRTGAEGAAAEVLRTAAVDARLLGLLAVLVAQLDVRVADFPASTAAPADGVLARRVLLDRSGGDPLTPGSPAAERLTTFLAAQRPPFAPDDVEVTADGVLIGFRYVSDPDAIVTARTP